VIPPASADSAHNVLDRTGEMHPSRAKISFCLNMKGSASEEMCAGQGAASYQKGSHPPASRGDGSNSTSICVPIILAANMHLKSSTSWQLVILIFIFCIREINANNVGKSPSSVLQILEANAVSVCE